MKFVEHAPHPHTCCTLILAYLYGYITCIPTYIYACVRKGNLCLYGTRMGKEKSGYISPLIPNFGCIWTRAVRLPPQTIYCRGRAPVPLTKGLHWYRNRSECLGEDKSLLFYQESNKNSLVVQSVHRSRYIGYGAQTVRCTDCHLRACIPLHNIIACLRTYVHTYKHTYIHTYTHTYIHTYIRT